jgi:hypothetical protein
LYLEYINSESYLEEQVAIKNFVSKMNYVGDFTDIGTESEIHLWIANNLSSTAFLNVTEAAEEWIIIKQLIDRTINANRVFYEALGNRNTEFKSLVLAHDENVQQPPVNIMVPTSCSDEFRSCTDGAATIYASTFIGAVGGAITGQITWEKANEDIAVAKGLFRMMTTICMDEFSDCVTGNL